MVDVHLLFRLEPLQGVPDGEEKARALVGVSMGGTDENNACTA